MGGLEFWAYTVFKGLAFRGFSYFQSVQAEGLVV